LPRAYNPSDSAARKGALEAAGVLSLAAHIVTVLRSMRIPETRGGSAHPGLET